MYITKHVQNLSFFYYLLPFYVEPISHPKTGVVGWCDGAG